MTTRVLVTGATGFIGSHVLAALREAGCEIVAAVPPGARPLPSHHGWRVEIDMAAANESAWANALVGVDCVVNTVGVFADGPGRSTHVHDRGAEALFRACEIAGVRRVIHFSALGVEDALTPFARTKVAGDRALMNSNLDWVILRPSIVLDVAPSGSGALIRGLAALPVLALEEGGAIEPVVLHDVVATVVALATKPTQGRRVLDLVGPERLTLGEIVARYRAWLGWRLARRVEAPGWLMTVVYALGDFCAALGWRTPIRSTAGPELERGATGNSAAWQEAIGLAPRRLGDELDSHPATVQERRFAQSYFLTPLVIAVTAAFWIGTGVTSLTFGYDIGVALLEEGGMGRFSGPSVIAGGLADLAIGAGVACRPTARLALWGAILISLFYAVAGTLLLPRLWLDPIGPMLKIWPLIALNIVALFLVRDR